MNSDHDSALPISIKASFQNLLVQFLRFFPSRISTAGRKSFRRGFLPLKFLLLATLGVLTGCGESLEDKMRAQMLARSNRPEKKDEETIDPAAARRVAGVRTDIEYVSSTSISSIKKQDEGSAEVDGAADEASLGLLPIDERKPADGLGAGQRRARALDNLKKVHAAMMKFVESQEKFPTQRTQTTSGFPALSWRVQILPELGYGELYRQFDQSKRWDEEPNLSLLQYIPPEYVSPERFDVKTNIQVPLRGGFVFDGKVNRTVAEIEDGLASTVFLMEVDDALAVEWTRPDDFVPNLGAGGDMMPLKQQLGQLRGDGIFSIWGNGYPVLLSNSLHPKEWWKAWSIDDGEVGLAGRIHRDITAGALGEGETATLEDVVEITTETASRPKQVMTVPMDLPENRQDVPLAIDLTTAQQRLRTLFGDEIRQAKTDQEKSRLADRFLADAEKLESDPAGMYALQDLARELAIEAGFARGMLRSVDDRVLNFNVDAYEANAEALLKFGKINSSKKWPASVTRPFLMRAVRTIYAGVQQNDFENAIAISRLAARHAAGNRSDKLFEIINQLSVSLTGAQAESKKLDRYLQAYRKDPSNDEAAATVGRYLCFIKGDWEQGLPLIAKGGSIVLQDLAVNDLAGAKDAAEQIAIGDGWWELSGKTTQELYRSGAMDRALHWYREAYESLPESLDRMYVSRRINEGDQDSGSPISLLRRLAAETRTNLEVPLAAVHRKSTTGDDEDDD
ncbi:MAG: DUF1559 domain-containing protein [Planctomycetota bacterium]